MGMNEDQASKIFSRFKRVNTTDTANIEGTGLGLFLIHRIITNAGGKILVSSEPGKGSTFTVWFKKD